MARREEHLRSELQAAQQRVVRLEQRCEQLEVENRRLRENGLGGEQPQFSSGCDAEELLRGQVEHLLHEKQQLAQAKQQAERENELLQDVIGYYEQMQADPTASRVGAAEAKEALRATAEDEQEFSSGSGTADSGTPSPASPSPTGPLPAQWQFQETCRFLVSKPAATEEPGGCGSSGTPGVCLGGDRPDSGVIREPRRHEVHGEAASQVASLSPDSGASEAVGGDAAAGAADGSGGFPKKGGEGAGGDVTMRPLPPRRTRTSLGLAPAVALLAGPLIFSCIAILFGAPLSWGSMWNTFLWASALSLLVLFPSSLLLGADLRQWHRLLLLCEPLSSIERHALYVAHGAVLGAWVGAWPIPLDWDAPWQVWPISCSFGMLGGALLGLALSVLVSSFRHRC